MPVVSETSICLFWDLSNQKWRTENNFTANAANTFGAQWFIVPAFINNNGPDKFDYGMAVKNVAMSASKVDITDPNTQIQKGDLSIPSDAGNTFSAKEQGLALQTDAITNIPYVRLSTGTTFSFVPVPLLRTPRKPSSTPIS